MKDMKRMKDKEIELFSKYPLLEFYLSDDQYQDGPTELWKQQQDMLGANRSILPLGRRFLASALHDSEITSIERDGDNLTINVDEIPVANFYSALTKTRGIAGPFPDFPVSLTFHNVQRLNVYSIDDDNKAIPVKSDKWLLRVNEYLYDHIAQVTPSCIEIAMILFSNKFNCEFIVEVKAERVEIVVNQPDVISGSVDEEVRNLLEMYYEEAANGEYFDHGVAEEFINKYLSKRDK